MESAEISKRQEYKIRKQMKSTLPLLSRLFRLISKSGLDPETIENLLLTCRCKIVFDSEIFQTANHMDRSVSFGKTNFGSHSFYHKHYGHHLVAVKKHVLRNQFSVTRGSVFCLSL